MRAEEGNGRRCAAALAEINWAPISNRTSSAAEFKQKKTPLIWAGRVVQVGEDV